MPSFNNPFNKAKREEAARQQKEREAVALQLKALHQQALNVATAIAQGRGDHVHIRPARPQQTINVLQVLNSGQELLQRLRTLQLPELSLEAFPLINSAQRQVQQLRDAVAQMPPAEQEVWQFQIKELDDEICNQTERIMAGAAALPPPPVNSRNLRASESGGRNSHHKVPAPAALSTASRPVQVKPSNSGRASSSAAAPARNSNKRGYTPPSLPELALDRTTSKHAASAINPAAGQLHAVVSGGRTNGFGPQHAATSSSQVAQPALQRGPSWTAAQLASVRAAAQVTGNQMQASTAGPSHGRQGVPANSGHATAAAATHGAAHALGAIAPRDMSKGGQQSAGTGSSFFPQQLSTPVTPNGAASHLASLQASPSTAMAHSTTHMQAVSPFSAVEPQANVNQGILASSSPPGEATSFAAAKANALGANGPFLSEQVTAVTGAHRTATSASKGLSLSLGRRLSSTSGNGTPTLLSGSAWSAGMTAAAAAAYAAQTGLSMDDLASKKAIKKKTRGVKVGYGLVEEEVPQEVSHVIPGQPMPGPEHLAQHWQSQLGAQQAGATHQQAPQEQQDAQVQALIQQRQAYLQAQQTSASPAALQAAGAGGIQSMDTEPRHMTEVSAVATVMTVPQQQQPAVLQPAEQVVDMQAQTLGAQRQQQQQQRGSQPMSGTSGSTSPVAGQQPPSVVADGPAHFKVTTTQPLQELSAYLEQLQGPINTIQQAAVQAAATVVATLATAVRQGHARQAEAHERCRAVLLRLTSLRTSIGQLEAQQASAVAAEDFDAAAQLDAPLQQTTAQQDVLQASLNQLREASSQAAELQTTLVAMQADACTTVAAYLARLQANHGQLLQGLESSAQQDATAANSASTNAAAAFSEARAALAQRKAQVGAAMEEVRARMGTANAALQQERNALAAQQTQLQDEVVQLRAQLSALEARLAEVSTALQQVTTQLQVASNQVQPVHAQLVAQQAEVEAAERELEAQMQQAEQQRQATEQHLRTRAAQHEALSSHGTSLGEAVTKLNGMAARIMTRVTADRDTAAAREQLRAGTQHAEQELQQHLRHIQNCEQQLAQCTEHANGNHSQLSQLQQAIAAVTAAVASLEANKAAAANQRDFREAGRIQAELRARTQQLEALKAQLAAAVIEAQQGTSGAKQLQGQLAALRADVPRLRRAEAYARWRYLIGSAQLRTRQLSGAAGLPDVVAVLRSEAEMELEEAAQLADTWGFEEDVPSESAPSTQSAAAAAAAAAVPASTSPQPSQQQQHNRNSSSLVIPTQDGVASEQTSHSLSRVSVSAGSNISSDSTPVAAASVASHHSFKSHSAAAVTNYPGHISNIMMQHTAGPASGSSDMSDTPHSVLSSTATAMSTSTVAVQQQSATSQATDPTVEGNASLGLVMQQWQSNELFDGLEVVDTDKH